jgi:hypothetical protein
MTHTTGHATSLANAVASLIDSEKFRLWRRVRPNRAMLAGERHYKPEELAELWGVSTETIRSIFREEPGVLKIGKTGSKYKRGYVTLRIPEEVMERVHRRLSA